MEIVEASSVSATPTSSELAQTLEQYRVELTAYCYRMLGSVEAEDAVQETFLRAWRAYERFEGRSSLRSWLYRIATNVCFDLLDGRERRARPMDLGPAREPDIAHLHTLPEATWIQPLPDSHLVADDGDPADVAIARETIRLAFVAALQHLPPRQRAVLVLRDVLDWSAKETAALLDTTTQSVNSALQRAKATLRARQPSGQPERAPPDALAEAERALLRRFVEAWERDDAGALAALMREDARWAMPPAPLWFEGRAAIENMLRLFPPTWQGRQFQMVATAANGQPAAAAYLRQPGEAVFQLSAVLVLRVEGREIAELTTFGPALCAGFGLPATR